MENYKNKTTALGAIIVLIAIGKSIVPEYFLWIE